MLRGVKDSNAKIEQLSKEEILLMMIFSMDAEALYPSIKKKDIPKEVKHIVDNCQSCSLSR